MSKGGEINYTEYAKAMRNALSGSDICLADHSLNHQYFNAKKGFYWSDDDDILLKQGIENYGTDWTRICRDVFRGKKSEV